jgi:hypothetical protein
MPEAPCLSMFPSCVTVGSLRPATLDVDHIATIWPAHLWSAIVVADGDSDAISAYETNAAIALHGGRAIDGMRHR